MSGTRSDAEHVLDLLGDDAALSLRRFFGGWSIVSDGQQVAIVMDTVYAKVDKGDREGWRAKGSRPFSYEAKGRTVVVEAYWSVPDDSMDDGEILRAVLGL